MCRRVRLHASCVTPRVLPGVTETQTNPCNVFPEEASIFIRRRWKSTHFFKPIQPNTLYVHALYIESSIQLLANRKIYSWCHRLYIPFGPLTSRYFAVFLFQLCMAIFRPIFIWFYWHCLLLRARRKKSGMILTECRLIQTRLCSELFIK